MRRAFCVLTLLVLSACYGTRPPVVGEPSRRGALPGTMPEPTSRVAAVARATCREISRTRCAAEACKGGNMDYVTLSCAGGEKVNRCVANLKCTVAR